MMGGGLPAWFVFLCCSPSSASSFVPSSSISVLRDAKKFLVGSPACGRIPESRAPQPVTTVLLVRLPCLSEGLLLASSVRGIPPAFPLTPTGAFHSSLDEWQHTSAVCL
jgi:hypothetical protein